MNLANIIKDPSVYGISGEGDGPAKHSLTVTLDNLQAITSKSEGADPSHIIPNMQKLKEECDVDMAHRLMAGKNGAFPLLVTFCKDYKDDQEIFLASMNALVSLCTGQPDLLTDDSAQLFCNFLQTFQANPEILVKIVELVRLRNFIKLINVIV